jgi:predicted phosphodiesterase
MDNYIKEIQLLADKVDGLSDESWQEIAEQLHYPYAVDTLRKSANGQYGGVAIYKYFLEHQDMYASDEQIKQFEKLKEDLYKERVRLQDVSREYHKELRVEARYENLIELLNDKIDLLEPIPFSFNSLQTDSCVEAVVLLGDIHFGAIVDNVKNIYNIDVAKERLSLWAQKVIGYCKQYKVNTLHVCLQGDLINGNIHLGQRVSQEEDVISQTVDMGEILSNVLQIIAANVPNIKIYGVRGNHDRTMPDKKQNIDEENFARLIYEYIKLRTGLKIIQNGKEDFVEFMCHNNRCVLTHGDKDNFSNAKGHFCDLLDYKPNYIYLGHVHHFMMSEENNINIVVNGSVISTDDYAMGIRKNTKPYQIMQIFDNDDVITCKIILS